ncbi:hypothetical protein AX14_013631 [Amanita brunnescens Koide BX004]|nr:hypothetical protein AX14_013631 [Amanita brunnescens Koide BX004]
MRTCITGVIRSLTYRTRDNVSGGRTLTGGSTSSNNMTTENCIAYCTANNFVYAGTEYASQCYCGNSISNGGFNTTLTDCNMACNGNAKEHCGGPNRLSFFWSGVQPPPPPVITPNIGKWSSLGCYSDNVNGRALSNQINLPDPVTNAACTTACGNAGYSLAGTEYATQCFCGNSIANGGASIAASGCNMVCAGNSSEFCGGPNRLNVYNYTGTLPKNGDGGLVASVVGPVLSGLPGTWSYNACWVDNAFGRILLTAAPGSTNNTVESCIAACQSQSFTVAGTEYGDECYCGDQLANGAVTAAEADCNMGCAGKTTEACGGPNRVSVYTSSEPITALPVPVTQKTGLPGQWSYAGCLQEVTNGRALPYQMIWLTNNSAVACMSQCEAFGYPVSGVEYGQECYCGDLTDIAQTTGTQKI